MDEHSPRTTEGNPTKAQLCDQIGRAVGSLWTRRSGVRPTSVNTEYVGDVVRCTIEDGETPPEPDADAAPQDDAIGEVGYQNQAQAAVRRLTGRTVMGFTLKPIKNTSTVTNAFILERIRTKY